MHTYLRYSARLYRAQTSLGHCSGERKEHGGTRPRRVLCTGSAVRRVDHFGIRRLLSFQKSKLPCYKNASSAIPKRKCPPATSPLPVYSREKISNNVLHNISHLHLSRPVVKQRRRIANFSFASGPGTFFSPALSPTTIRKSTSPWSAIKLEVLSV